MKKTFHIKGTHCASCEVLLERRLKKIPGVTNACVDFASGKSEVTSTAALSAKDIRAAVNADGYKAVLDADRDEQKPLGKNDYLEIAALVLVFAGLYIVLKRVDLFPNISVGSGMSLGLVFVIGLIAGTSTCLAVTGGLLLALSAKFSESHPKATSKQQFIPILYFNAGRIIGYIVFGAALGALGSLFTFSPATSGIITVIAALIMIVLGLQMLRVIPFLSRIRVAMPKWIAHAIHDKTGQTYKPWAPMVLGAGTFFVPCGFTQALQFFVLAQGSAMTGSLTMLFFAIGTLPMLLLIGVASSFTRGPLHKHFIRAAAVLVVLLGILSIPAGFTLLNIALS